MLIDLRELLSGTKEEMKISAEYEHDVFKTGVDSYEIIKKEPFDLTLRRVSKNQVAVEGSGSVTLIIPCNRCLEPVDTVVDFDIDKVFNVNQEAGTEEDQEEQDYIDGYNLDVDELVFAEVLMNIPGKTLCSEDCKGLCLICGNNLNIKDCGCDRESLDPRMSVFKDILNNFKEV
ncbi:MAG: DUF177 domain-containing protein [Eubacteriales bacterium]|nr:DUF177 domain-containing protein [Eubacteriales bacterium]